jgi:hypothetical protein
MMVQIRFVGNKDSIEKVVYQIEKAFDLVRVGDFLPDDGGRGYYVKFICEVKE